MFYQIKYKYY